MLGAHEWETLPAVTAEQRARLDFGAQLLQRIQHKPDVYDLGAAHEWYTELFWRPFLGQHAYDIYRAIMAWSKIRPIELQPPLTVAFLGHVIGRTGRGLVEDGLRRLAREMILFWRQSEAQTRERPISAHYLPILPVLTPLQAEAGLDRRQRDLHEYLLGAVPGFDLPGWRQLDADSLVPVMVKRIGLI